jgi:hypothetical protein
MMREFTQEQTRLLAVYASEELGRMVLTHEYWNRTYNLEDSYVWAVYFNGKKKQHGFFTNKVATKNSYLHEWGKKESRVPVNGRRCATEFINSYVPSTTKGWEVIWAAAAPYGAYLEAGFRLPSGRRIQFDVISQRYDHIKHDLGSKVSVRLEITFPS